MLLKDLTLYPTHSSRVSENFFPVQGLVSLTLLPFYLLQVSVLRHPPKWPLVLSSTSVKMKKLSFTPKSFPDPFPVPTSCLSPAFSYYKLVCTC